MGKTAKTAMEYEDSDKLFKTKTTKKDTKKMKELPIATVKSYDIYKMGTGAIVWHLIKRHKLAISVTLNIVLILVNTTGGRELIHLIWR